MYSRQVRQLHRYSDVLLHVQMREGCLCWDGDKDLLLNTHLLVDVSVTERKHFITPKEGDSVCLCAKDKCVSLLASFPGSSR